MNGKRILAGVVLLAAVAAAAFALRTERSDAQSARVTRGEFTATVESTGRLEAAVAFEIGPPSVRDVWSYNLTWMIPEGTRVERGTPVARFDATDMDERLRDYNAALETTIQEREKEERNLEVSLKQLRLDLVKAEGELKKVNLDLAVPEGLVSSIEVQQTRLKKELAERRVAFLKEKIDFEQELVDSKLRLLAVKRDYHQGKIDYTEKTKASFNRLAPVSGMVVYVPKRGNDRWEIGESVWMMAKILKVADVSTLQVEANVLEVDAAKIKPGQPATITVDAVPGLLLQSQVKEIGKIVRERSLQDRSKVFDAILPLTGFDPEVLRPGMSVKVKIETDRIDDALSVPLEAVSSTPDGQFVTVLKGSRRERRAVILGPRNDQRVVIEQGLQESEQVLLGAA